MFRLSSHSLSIETGRYQGVLNVNRVCKFCKVDIEVEFHFILVRLTRISDLNISNHTIELDNLFLNLYSC